MGKEINKKKKHVIDKMIPRYTRLWQTGIFNYKSQPLPNTRETKSTKQKQPKPERNHILWGPFPVVVILFFLFFFVEGPSLCQWETLTDQSPMVAVGRCRWTTTMDPQEHHPLLMSSGVTVPPMHKPRWINIITITGIWRRGSALLVLGQSLLLGLWLILSCRGRRGLLATRCILLRAKWRGPSEKASGGSKLSTANWFMGGPDMLGWGFI